MIKLSLFLTLLFFPLACCYCQEQKSTSVQGEAMKPAETQDTQAWDFGQVKAGEKVKHNFILKNESANTVTIKEVNTSCGCTASKVDKNVLAPGESANITVTFNSTKYSGEVKQFVYVHTDILDKPIIKLIITADVIKN